MRKVLIVDEVHPSMAEGLTNLGFEVETRTDLSLAEFTSILPGYEGLVVRSKFKITADILTDTTLTFIARAGAGLDLLDVDACLSRGIAVFSANKGNSDAVAEHVIGQLLSLAHKLHTSDTEVRHGLWEREGNRGFELKGKTIGIIGYGNMGKAVASRLACFGMTILAYDKYTPSADYPATMEQLFEQADIVSLHIPLTSETRGLISVEFLESFKKPILLINSSRGPIAPLEPLLRGLRSGRIKGLALDVLPNEKLSTWSPIEKELFTEIAAYPATIFSPHVAGWTTESYYKINEVLLEKIKLHFSL
ncbi:phosphoglycerate dehydrogenase [Aquirufa antheringensis]|uniref:NAD(P)-dependent oxidoreductase n=1 Tax=Aquirufa antheringensis TaxID=2516559 RepID=UPI0022A8852F|nr:NAD(P)-dependent oxidoreductase [Aquirufa antheringensis]MCZ2477065.1 phosphoglycerate dehydrogenase [Aquirufa antheringensis]